MKTAKLLMASWIGLVALSASVYAAPLDLLAANSNLAIYHSEYPDAVEIPIFMIDNDGSTTNWGSLGSNTDDEDVLFVSNAPVQAKNGNASLVEIYKPPAGPHPAEGAEFLTLDITVPGYQFGDLIFGTQKADSFTVSVFSDAFSLINPLGSYSFTKLGENLETFMVLAEGPYAITRVLLSAMTGDSFFEIKHFKISSLQRCGVNVPCGSTPDVPLPAALPLLLGGLGGLTWLSRSKRRKLAA